ncbi:MAG: insulinase family protein [Clostridia bacterium]|nr:insulinase family protein [Clostridia bacterium]
MNTNFESMTLKNGLGLKTLKNSFLHSVTMGLYVKKLPEPVCGIAHLVEHLFFRRLDDIQQEELYHETDCIGATLNATTYADFICFNVTVSPRKITEAFQLLPKIFNTFEWNHQEISAEKEVVKRQIEDRYVSVYTKADLDYYKGTSKGTLLMGRLSDINKMSAKEINTYKNNMFAPQNACFVLTGNFNNDDIAYCIKLLNRIPASNDVIFPTSSPSVSNFSRRHEKADKIYSATDEFADVCISFDVDENKINRYAAELLFSILGFGVTSKLSQGLREQKGFVNEINGNIEFSDYAGRMTFEYSVIAENLSKSLWHTFEILTQAKNNLTDIDLQRNIMFYTENQYRLLDDAQELNFLIGWRAFIEKEQIKSVDDLIERYKKITIEDIRYAANEILKPKNLIISVSNNNKILSKAHLTKSLKDCRKKLEV